MKTAFSLGLACLLLVACHVTVQSKEITSRQKVPACMDFPGYCGSALYTEYGGKFINGKWVPLTVTRYCENGNVTEKGVEAGIRNKRDEFGHTLEDACCKCGGGIPGSDSWYDCCERVGVPSNCMMMCGNDLSSRNDASTNCIHWASKAQDCKRGPSLQQCCDTQVIPDGCKGFCTGYCDTVDWESLAKLDFHKCNEHVKNLKDCCYQN